MFNQGWKWQGKGREGINLAGEGIGIGNRDKAFPEF